MFYQFILSSPNLGTVEEGKVASLLLLNGNPLIELDYVTQPAVILLEGRVIRRLKKDVTK